jgi:hypothetical protein
VSSQTTGPGQTKAKFTFLTGSQNDIALDAATLSASAPNLSAQDQAILSQITQSLNETGRLPFAFTPQEENFLRLNPRQAWAPYLIYRYKFKVFPARHAVADFPVYVLIEPVSTCNLRCVMCFQIDRTFTRKPFAGIMAMDLYRRIIDEIAAGGTKAITFASRGEPTLHPQLGAMLAYASAGSRFFDLKLNTNATRLDEKLCHAILQSGVNEMVFSVDAHEKALYEEIRVRGDFDQVLANIERFHAIRARHYPQSKLRTRVSGVRFRPDQDGAAFAAFWSKIVDHVGYTEVENRWDTYNSAPDDLTEPCTYLWERLYVWFDGTCNPCDVDYKSELSPGTLRTSSIRDIWHGPDYSAVRAAHLAKNRGAYVPCDRCGV